MEFSFTVKGHENILGTHDATLEFTKDTELTKRGNCIIGVDADFDSSSIQDFIKTNKKRKILVEISSGKEQDSFVCFINSSFKSNSQLVFRKSDFISERTFGINAAKSSLELDRKLMESIKASGAEITLKPIKHKCIIFDFDNTLEEFENSKSKGELAVAKEISKKYGHDEKEVKKLLENVDNEFTTKGLEKKDITLYDRIKWYHEYAKRNKIDIPESEIKKLVKIYWETINKEITAISGAHELLTSLKKAGYILAMLTDSDGAKKIKTDRIEKLRLEKYFELIVTGDDTQTTKPDEKNLKYLLDQLNKNRKDDDLIKFEECISIGDKPPADLMPCKPLGITTIWFKYGRWKTIITEKPQYVDFEAKKLAEAGRIIEQL
ncbi:MAG: DUF371 domain-containing protein [Nanoarchaeota archaeon]|nr:DUF371 domain-containing protein [Nanoarchaeota archaeon]